MKKQLLLLVILFCAFTTFAQPYATRKSRIGKANGVVDVAGWLNVNQQIYGSNLANQCNPNSWQKVEASVPFFPFATNAAGLQDSISTYNAGAIRIGSTITDTIWAYLKSDMIAVINAMYSTDNGTTWIDAGVCIERNTGTDNINQVRDCRPFYSVATDTIHFLYNGYTSGIDGSKARVFYASTTRANPDTALYNQDGDNPVLIPDSLEAWTGINSIIDISPQDIILFHNTYYIGLTVCDSSDNSYYGVLLSNAGHLGNSSDYRFEKIILYPYQDFKQVGNFTLWREDSTFYAYQDIRKETLANGSYITAAYASKIKGTWKNLPGLFMLPNIAGDTSFCKDRIYTPYLLKTAESGNSLPDTLGGYGKLFYSGSKYTGPSDFTHRAAMAKVYFNTYEIENNNGQFADTRITNYFGASQTFGGGITIPNAEENTSGDGIYILGMDLTTYGLKFMKASAARIAMDGLYLWKTDRFAIGTAYGDWRYIITGNNSPEGVQTGNPGDLYTNKLGGINTSGYLKVSGTSTNTGWEGIATINSDGDLEINGVGDGIIMKSPDGTRWRLTVSNAGAAVFTSL